MYSRKLTQHELDQLTPQDVAELPESDFKIVLQKYVSPLNDSDLERFNRYSTSSSSTEDSEDPRADIDKTVMDLGYQIVQEVNEPFDIQDNEFILDVKNPLLVDNSPDEESPPLPKNYPGRGLIFSPIEPRVSNPPTPQQNVDAEEETTTKKFIFSRTW